MAECKVNLKDSPIDKSLIQKLNHWLVTTQFSHFQHNHIPGSWCIEYICLYSLNKAINDNCSGRPLKLFPELWTNKTVV